MTGVDFLQQAMVLYPEAKRVLLTAYADTEAAIRAINAAKIHYYLNKPLDPPEEKLYPVLSDLLEEGSASGEFHIADVRVAALGIGGMVSWAYTWYQPEGRLPIEEVGSKLAHFALQMVGVQRVSTPL